MESAATCGLGLTALVVADEYRATETAAPCARYVCTRYKESQMSLYDDEDTRLYTVLVNDEEQYSLWLKDKPVPAGWRAVGKEGTKDECSKYVDEVWVDMRPLSLRKKMGAASVN
jgi:MbtH protein